MHPNVVPIYNVESDAKTPYIVMHYVAGQSLQRRVDVSGPLPIVDALRIAQQTAAGLSAAHAQGLVHRDVKPANILLEEKIDRVLLSDFGLARAVDDASLTKTGIVAGTPHYMSPEQALGEAVDHRSDVFSLGSVLYFMLAGHPPFRASSAMAVLHRICQFPHRSLIEVNRDVPIEVSQLVDRLLAKKTNERITTAAEAERELSKLLTNLQQRGVSIQSNTLAPKQPDRWPLPLVKHPMARRASLILAAIGLILVGQVLPSLMSPMFLKNANENQHAAEAKTSGASTVAEQRVDEQRVDEQREQRVAERQFWQAMEYQQMLDIVEINSQLDGLQQQLYLPSQTVDDFEMQVDLLNQILDALQRELNAEQ